MSTDDAFHCFIFGCLISSSFTYVFVKSKFFYWVFPLCWISHSFCQVSHLHCLFSYLGPHWIFWFFAVIVTSFYCLFKFLEVVRHYQMYGVDAFFLLFSYLIIEALWDFWGVPNCVGVGFSCFSLFLCYDLYIFGVDPSIFFPYPFFCFILCGFSYWESSLSHQATRKNIFKNPDTKMQ